MPTCCTAGGGSCGGPGQCVSRQWKAALVGGADRGVGAEGRPADSGDRFFERVLAAHRGTADAAGTDWKSAVYRKIEEEVEANRGLTVKRMAELGGVSRPSFYRFEEEDSPKVDRDMDLRDAIQRIALKWPRYGRPRITAELKRKVGRWGRTACDGSCGRITCCACGNANSW